jgi:hypothetical protein
MKRKKVPAKKARRPATAARRKAAGGARGGRAAAPRVEALRGAIRKDVGGVRLEFGRAGTARVKRAVYPAGFRWSVHMKPVIGTDLCMHAHVGYLESGTIRIEYPDGFVDDFVAPQIVAIAPGHDGLVVGRSPAVLIEFDFEGATVERLGMPPAHQRS